MICCHDYKSNASKYVHEVLQLVACFGQQGQADGLPDGPTLVTPPTGLSHYLIDLVFHEIKVDDYHSEKETQIHASASEGTKRLMIMLQ